MNSKFGIYDKSKSVIVCDPISDRSRLGDILLRHGIVADSRLESAQSFGDILLLPSIDDRPAPPAKFGWSGSLTNWEYDVDRESLFRATKWVRANFEEFERQLVEFLGLERDRALSFVEKGYSDKEVKTWSRQQVEAAMWVEDNGASVPLLSSMSMARGVSVSDLVVKISEKTAQAAELTGFILGSVQAAEDKIEILAQATIPDDWFDQMQLIAGNWQAGWPAELLGG